MPRISAGWPTRPPSADRRHACRSAALIVLLGWAATVRGDGLAAPEPSLLPPEQAFQFSARALDAHTLEVRFDVAEGYYLYRDKLAFTIVPGVVSAPPDLPEGKRKHDAFFGDVETYRGHLALRVPVAQLKPGQSLTLRAESQGCADAGVCYPATAQQVKLTLPAEGVGPGPVVQAPRKHRWFD